MPSSLTVTAARARLYVNNQIYRPTKDVTVSVDSGEYEIRGINTPFAQEIAGGGQYSVKGRASIVRTSNSGGLQAVNLRPLFSDGAASNYVSLRMEDRQTGETLWSIPKAKVSNVNESVGAKGVYNVSFDFIGVLLFWPLDLS